MGLTSCRWITIAKTLARRRRVAQPACVASTMRPLWRGRIHLPARHVGMRLRFAGGTSARVYRETVVDRDDLLGDSALGVEFTESVGSAGRRPGEDVRLV